MSNYLNGLKSAANRRSFLKKGAVTGAATIGGALLGGGVSAYADDDKGQGKKNGKLNKGDAALIRFVAAAETLEADFWIQYNELGGV